LSATVISFLLLLLQALATSVLAILVGETLATAAEAILGGFYAVSVNNSIYEAK
jgi:hypothetical protein